MSHETLTAADVGVLNVKDIVDSGNATPRLATLKAELQKREAELEAKLTPYRADYERLLNDPRLIECRKAIKQINSELLPVKNELAALTTVGRKNITIEIEPGEYANEGGKLS